MTTKPEKPTPDFPLFPHANGQWAKKIGGKLNYFGHWDDPWGAVRELQEKFPQLVPTGVKIADATVPSKSKTATKTKAKKVAKPTKDFPLYPHASGQWSRSIRGKTRYFGPLSEPAAARERYEREREYWERGEVPPSRYGQGCHDGITVRDLCNQFLAAMEDRVAATTLAQRTFGDYQRVCEMLRDFFGADRPVQGLQPHDFSRLAQSWAKKYGPKSRENFVTRAKVILTWGSKAPRSFYQALQYGEDFRKPSAIELRQARALTGRRMFEPDQILAMLDHATPSLKAMILLGINCGFITVDCALLPFSKLDLENGWHNLQRLKTWQGRRCPLWPETVTAIQAAIAHRPEPKDPEAVVYRKRLGQSEWVIRHRDLVFITQRKLPWTTAVAENPVSKRMRELMRKVGIESDSCLNFGSLRHTFATVAGDTLDGFGVSYIMGHVARSDDMKAHYTRRMADSRLKNITNYVRDWLFKRTDEPLVAGRNVGGEQGAAAQGSPVTS